MPPTQPDEKAPVKGNCCCFDFPFSEKKTKLRRKARSPALYVLTPPFHLEIPLSYTINTPLKYAKIK